MKTLVMVSLGDGPHPASPKGRGAMLLPPAGEGLEMRESYVQYTKTPLFGQGVRILPHSGNNFSITSGHHFSTISDDNPFSLQIAA